MSNVDDGQVFTWGWGESGQVILANCSIRIDWSEYVDLITPPCTRDETKYILFLVGASDIVGWCCWSFITANLER